mgnify:CR=1 FL=1
MTGVELIRGETFHGRKGAVQNAFRYSVDYVLLEPDHRDPELYLANTFSYAQRRQLAEHAYQQTRALLRAQRSRLSEQLLRHGITLNLPILNDNTRQLIAPSQPASRWGQALGTLEGVMEDLSQVVHHKTMLRH